MKIGEFANKYNVSQDTIRYYIKQKMLLPQKKNGQYNFCNICEEDMQNILELKTCHFSIKEIKKILFYMRVSKLDINMKDAFLKELMEQRAKEVRDEIEELLLVEEKIEKQINKLNNSNQKIKISKLGVPISFISNMCCPKCKKEYKIFSSSIVENNIIEGELVCECDKLIIEDGIIISKTCPKFDGKIIEFAEYVKETNVEYFNILYSMSFDLKDKIDFSKYSNKILLELGTGFGLFIRAVYEDLPKNSTYICVDYNYKYIKKLKNIFEKISISNNIIFLNCRFEELPLKENTVDCLFDYAGRTNYYFHKYEYKEKFNKCFFKMIDNVLKRECDYFGTHYLVKTKVKQEILSEDQMNMFNREYIKKELENLDFKILYSKKSEEMPMGGKYERVHFDKDDKVEMYNIFSVRK